MMSSNCSLAFLKSSDILLVWVASYCTAYSSRVAVLRNIEASSCNLCFTCKCKVFSTTHNGSVCVCVCSGVCSCECVVVCVHVSVGSCECVVVCVCSGVSSCECVMVCV